MQWGAFSLPRRNRPRRGEPRPPRAVPGQIEGRPPEPRRARCRDANAGVSQGFAGRKPSNLESAGSLDFNRTVLFRILQIRIDVDSGSVASDGFPAKGTWRGVSR